MTSAPLLAIFSHFKTDYICGYAAGWQALWLEWTVQYRRWQFVAQQIIVEQRVATRWIIEQRVADVFLHPVFQCVFSICFSASLFNWTTFTLLCHQSGWQWVCLHGILDMVHHTWIWWIYSPALEWVCDQECNADKLHCCSAVYCPICWCCCLLFLTADFKALRRLQSASSLSLNVRRTRLSTVCDQTFPVTAARTWNSLPQHVTSTPSMSVFRGRPKGFLFRCSFPWLSPPLL